MGFAAKPQSRWPPRTVWVSLHTVGIGFMGLSGGWPFGGWSGTAYEVTIALNVIFYIGASFRDPGYAPLPSSPSDGGKPPLQEALLQAPACIHCGATTALRTKHCHDCCRCVRRMDHHCWWLGNCVGERNHCNFLCYLLTQTTLLISTCAAAVSNAATSSTGESHHASSLPVAPALSFLFAITAAALCIVTGFAALTLLLFQTALMLRGETTWEKLRRAQLNAIEQLPPDERPYDRGALRNALIFCGCERDPGVPKWAEGVPWQRATNAAAICPVATARPLESTAGAAFPSAIPQGSRGCGQGGGISSGGLISRAEP